MLLRQYRKKSPDSRRLAEALHLLFVNRYDQIFRDSLRASVGPQRMKSRSIYLRILSHPRIVRYLSSAIFTTNYFGGEPAQVIDASTSRTRHEPAIPSTSRAYGEDLRSRSK